MKKIIAMLLMLVAVCLALGACGCEHTYESAITTEPTCTAEGVKTYTCTQCQDSYTEQIPMIEHSYTSAVTKESTCAEKGVTTFTCSACNDSYTEEIALAEHTYTSAVTKESTCKEKGVTTFTCSVCNDSYTEEIALAEHTFGKSKVTKKATCTAEGEKSATCTVCGETKVVDKVSKADHKYKKTVKTAATCTAGGVNILTCSDCGHSKEASVKALGHNYKQSVITKVTCTSDGEVAMTCSRCKDSYKETKKATGHNWVDASCTKAKHCKNCNLTEGNALGHTTKNGTCGRCNKYISLASSCKLSKPSLPASFTFSTGIATINSCGYTFKSSGGYLVLYIETYGKCSITNREGYMQTVCYAVITNGTNTYKQAVHVGLYNNSNFHDTLWFDGIEPGEYVLTYEKAK